jgi:hypothetical protein
MKMQLYVENVEMLVAYYFGTIGYVTPGGIRIAFWKLHEEDLVR